MTSGSLAAWTPKAGPQLGITVYGCGPDEAELFREIAPRLNFAPRMTEAPVSEATIDLAFGNRCISVGHKTRITNTTLRALAKAGVAYLSTRSIGMDHLDVRYAEGVGITVGNVSYSPDSVADFTVMLMLMAIRDAGSIVRRTGIHDYRLSSTRGRELRDLTVGVVGTGRIGTAVVTRLRGFGTRILTYDKAPSTDHVPLDELLQRSDIVTLHIPLTDETHHLLDKDRIERMKPGACVVNTARGPLIDTAALIEALETGRLGGAALDVVEGEEGTFYADCSDRPVDSPFLPRLQRLPNVVISPHTAYYTDRALRDAVENSIVNCLRFENRKREWI